MHTSCSTFIKYVCSSPPFPSVLWIPEQQCNCDQMYMLNILHTRCSQNDACRRLLQRDQRTTADKTSSPALGSDPALALQAAAAELASPPASQANASEAVALTALLLAQQQQQQLSQTNADSTAALMSWPSSFPGALPGASAQTPRHNVPHLSRSRQQAQHEAVEKSGSGIPVLGDEAEHDSLLAELQTLSEPNQQPVEHLPLTSSAQEGSQKADAKDADTGTGMDVASYIAADVGLLPYLHEASAHTVDAAAALVPKEQQQHESTGVELNAVAFKAQVLRRRLSYNKPRRSSLLRSNRVGPDAMALPLPGRSVSAIFSDTSQGRSPKALKAPNARQELTELPKLGKCGTVAKAYSKKKHDKLSMQDMLRQSIDQVCACTEQLQQQRQQQQQLQKDMQAMKRVSIAMLDHAISAALQDQQL